MSRQQKIAIENPCEFAEQCSNPIYFRVVTLGKLIAVTGVTVNVGQE
jgi:hypothetical protein